ncbi:hypothetical protein MCOR27_009093 [Pyricularia oryzae]|uniref:Uncharacterized protein n=2 Tax=Pyricularia TaxID=48558 RepID=A0ABQ8NCW3_PYRGI|nr:hypothetical protein MCOR01_001383 [Pyricularia oryzae]KAI6294918.1 hypothetical protein MCOR33_008081 [Pyricularia grisea]KAH9430074.1 hypothetical protein MCOR02_009795 [Pyricularia oryzae]KAI6254871.1 hypothetical protein MCOR19_008631 [Pyricularia oryzae]KAI6270875.1 hypothetical protein MCOR27_009093 [Pyricularia oryzae]
MKPFTILATLLTVTGFTAAQSCRQLSADFCQCGTYCYRTRDGGCNPAGTFYGLCPLKRETTFEA